MDKKDIVFLRAFFAALEENGISYCVLRNEMEILSGDSHDVDMAIDASKKTQFEVLLKNIAEIKNWKFDLIVDKENYSLRSFHLYNTDEEVPVLLHFDVFDTYCWVGYNLISNQTLLKGRKKIQWLYVADETVQVTTMLFSRLLYHGYVKEKYKDYINRVFSQKSSSVLNILAEFLPKDMAERALEQVINSDWEGIENNIGEIRDSIYHSYSTPRSIIRIKVRLFQLSRALHPLGLNVVINGSEVYIKDTQNSVRKMLSRSYGGDYTKIIHVSGQLRDYFIIWKLLCQGAVVFTEKPLFRRHSIIIDESESDTVCQVTKKILNQLNKKYR